MAKYSEKMRVLIGNAMRKDVHRVGIELIREQGWKAFTTEHIAEKLGMSRSVLYNYFENKEAIARSIIETSVARLCERLTAIAGQTGRTAAARLREMVELGINDFVNQRELHRVFMTHLAPPPPGADSPPPFHRRSEAIFEHVLEEGIQNGEFAADFDPRLAVRLLTGGMRELCLSAVFDDDTPNAKGLFDIFFKGVQRSCTTSVSSR